MWWACDLGKPSKKKNSKKSDIVTKGKKENMKGRYKNQFCYKTFGFLEK